MLTRTRRVLAGGFVLGGVLLLVAHPLSTAGAEFANSYGVAVVIGNRGYAEDIPEVEFAHRDAEAVKGYVVDVLGFDPENIIDLRDATQSQMWSTFGSRTSADGSDLWSYLDPDGRSDVVVFYSGHGAPGLNDKRGYLLPVDADPNTAELNGYPIDGLYKNLSHLKEARSVTVYLDACFSGGSGGGGMLIQSASPVYVGASLPEESGERLSVLTAATGDQLASWDRKAGHGLFTHHLLNALHGKADKDGDGQVTAREAKGYLDFHMTRAARRTYKRRQNVSFTGNADTVLAAVPAGRGFPARRELALVDARPAADGKPAAMRGIAPTLPPAAPVSIPRPAETPEAVEAALGLMRRDRKLIQHGLTALELNVGLADGVFGPRTRRAVSAWQESKGYPVTGYLTGEQVAALQSLGQEVAAERKAREERKSLAKALRTDEEAFKSAKNVDTAEAYRRYLVEHSTGLYVAEARELHGQRQDEEAFAQAESVNTTAGYHDYVMAYPTGLYAAQARQRRDELQAEEQQAQQQSDVLKVFGAIMGGILKRQ